MPNVNLTFALSFVRKNTIQMQNKRWCKTWIFMKQPPNGNFKNIIYGIYWDYSRTVSSLSNVLIVTNEP